MARRLLGADNAATVLNSQGAEEEPVMQVRPVCVGGVEGVTHTCTHLKSDQQRV